MNGNGVEHGEGIKTKSIARVASDPAAIVYYDKPDFFVSSKEVRVRDTLFSLDEIEYVGHESYGWMCFLIFLLTLVFIALIALSIRLEDGFSLTFFLLALYSLFPIFMSPEPMSFFKINSAYDRFGLNRLYIFTKDGMHLPFSFPFHNPRRGSVSRFCDALAHAVHNRIVETLPDLPESYPSSIPPGTRINREMNIYTTLTGSKARLFNMVWDIDSISGVRRSQKTEPLRTVSMICGALAALSIILNCTSEFYPMFFLLFIYFMLLMFFTKARSAPVNLVIEFKDGSKKTVSKNIGDDLNKSLEWFEDIVIRRLSEKSGTEERQLRTAIIGGEL